MSENGKLGNTAVFGLDITVKVKSRLVSILKESKRIEESKRGAKE